MKGIKLTLIIALAAAMTFALAPTAKAFHSGGVAECVGCHSMHAAVAADSLLIASDISSTCLNCHNSATGSAYTVSTDESVIPAGTPPANMTPGGDFGWLKKNYLWVDTERCLPGPCDEDGDRHGHNIVAADFNYVADTTNLTAPGGTMDASDLACTSCHDQHSKLRRLSDGSIATGTAPIIASGSYNDSPVPGAGEAVGVYRLLRGAGSDPGSGGITFTDPVPAAVAPSTYNRSEAATDTRVAYGAGMSRFCATCHPDFHTDSANLVHPVDQNLGSEIATIYNDYVGSGNLSGNQIQGPYDSLVPFQVDNSTDYAALAAQAVNDGSVTTGAASTDQVMCLTCHRAHASGWEYASRWDNEIALIIVDGEWPGTDAVSAEASLAQWAKGRTVSERSRAYNDTLATDYATFQRVLCNKCHAKD
jgi:predicted CXXCH cytochrome family protein